MKRIYLLLLILPILGGLMSCQMENGNEKNVIPEEKNALQEPVVEIQECIANNNYESIDRDLPLFGILDKDANLLVIGNPQDIPLAGTYEGRKAIHEYFAKSHQKIRILGVTIQDILREGNLLNAHLRVRGQVKATRSTFDIEYVYAMTMDKFRISSMVVYYDTFNFRRAMLEPGPLAVQDIQNPAYPASDPKDTTNYRPYVEAGLKAFYVDGDVPTFLSFMHPEIQWVFKGDTGHVPFAGLYSGLPGMMDFIPRVGYNLYPMGLTITGSVEQGNRVDYFMVETGYAIPTTKVFVSNVLQTYLFKDGKVIEFKTYNDTYAVSQAYTTN